MKTTTANATQTATLTRNTEGVGNTKSAPIANPVGVSAKYSDLLGCMKYNRDGGLNTADNAWHDDHFYCKAVEVTATIDGKTVGLGRNPHEQFCHSVAKKWRLSREWMPDRIHTPTECEEQEAVVTQTLFECLASGETEECVGKCFTALDDHYGSRKQDTHKTLPREENLWAPERAFIATLFTGDLATVGGKAEDLTADCEYGALSVKDGERLARLATLFDAVKESHKFATREKWLCAQCYALNMPTEVGINTVYGVEIAKTAGKPKKTADRVLNSCRVKYSRHANDVFGWLLDEVEKNPDGLEKWVVVLDHCKAMVEATATLEECAVKCRLNDEVVKTLKSEIASRPTEVIRYCKAVAQMAVNA